MMIDLTELNKLIKLLEENNIPFEYSEIDIPFPDEKNGYQIVYPNIYERKSDVIISPFSYGHEDGLLEQMGLLPDDVLEMDVQGWLDAETVFKRWYDDYNS